MKIKKNLDFWGNIFRSTQQFFLSQDFWKKIVKCYVNKHFFLPQCIWCLALKSPSWSSWGLRNETKKNAIVRRHIFVVFSPMQQEVGYKYPTFYTFWLFTFSFPMTDQFNIVWLHPSLWRITASSIRAIFFRRLNNKLFLSLLILVPNSLPGSGWVLLSTTI